MATRNRSKARREARAAAPATAIRKADPGKITLIIYAGSGHDPTACIESVGVENCDRIYVVTESEEWAAPAPAETVRGDRTAGRIKASNRHATNFIVFMDADARLEAGALNFALAHLASGAAVVGGLLIDDLKQHTLGAGFVFAVSGKPFYRFHGWSLDHPKVQKAASVQAVPFGFLATRRDILRKVPFRPEFGPHPYGEADYCCRIRNAKLGDVIYEPDIKVYTRGLLVPAYSDTGLQLLLASGRPAYDEWCLL